MEREEGAHGRGIAVGVVLLEGGHIMAAGGAAVAAAAAAMAQAIKAFGTIVRVEPQNFAVILARAEAPLVVLAQSGWPKKTYQYLTSYKGLAFFAKSPEPLALPEATELIVAEKILIPS